MSNALIDSISMVYGKQFQNLVTYQTIGDTLTEEMKEALLNSKNGDVAYIDAFVGSKKHSLAFKIE